MTPVETLLAVRRHGGSLKVEGGFLILEADEDLPDDLVQEVTANKPALLQLLTGDPGEEPPIAPLPRRIGGQYLTLAETALLAWWESGPSLPRQPFTLGHGERVVDPEKFYALLGMELAAGPRGLVWTRAVRQLHELAQIAAEDTGTAPAGAPKEVTV